MSGNVVETFKRIEVRVKGIEATLATILARLDRIEKLESSSTVAETIQLPSGEIQDGDFVYQALNEAQKEIRVLVVYGGVKDEDDVVCELVHVSLDWELGFGEVPEGKGKLEVEAVKKFNTLSYTV